MTSAHSDLSLLNSSSAKVCAFPVRVQCPRLEHYQYKDRAGNLQKGCTFKCELSGLQATSYCEGVGRAAQKDLDAMKARFTHGSCWVLSKVCFDTKSPVQYISSPLKFAILLNAPTKAEKASEKTTKDLPQYMQPLENLSNASLISSSGVCFDILAILRDLSPEKVVGNNNRVKATAEFLDDSAGAWHEFIA
eukprot:s1620_g4.t1